MCQELKFLRIYSLAKIARRTKLCLVLYFMLRMKCTGSQPGASAKIKRTPVGVLFILVEATGIEPVSENPSM